MRIKNSIVPLFAVISLAAGLLAPALASAGTYPGANGKIAFSADDGIHIMNSDGTNNITIAGTGGAVSGTPRISPDGSKVAWGQFASQVYSGPSSYANVRVANIDGTNVVNMTPAGSGGHNDTDPTWSPDGKWLAFRRDGVLAIGNSTGTNLDQSALTFPNGSDVFSTPAGCSSGGQNNLEPSWSPDGATIVFARKCDAGTGGIWKFAVNYTVGSSTAPTISGTEARVTTGGTGASSDFWPSWSPNGNTILYTHNDGSKNVIAEIPAAGGTAQYNSTVTDSVVVPVFSPDGTKIAYTHGTGATFPGNGVGVIDAASFATAPTSPDVTGTTNASGLDWGSNNAQGDGTNGGDAAASASGGAQAGGAAAPGTPNTGFSLVSAHPATSFIVTSIAAAILFVLAKRFKPSTGRR